MASKTSRPLHAPDSAAQPSPRRPWTERLRSSPLAEPRNVALIGAAAFIACCLLVVMQDALIDDAYISLDYARTLSEHHQWALIPGMAANTATSPLNVMILATLTTVVRSPMAALWIATIVNAMVLTAGLIRLSERWLVGFRFACVAMPLLLLNPLLASSIGLETMLSVSLLVWLLNTGMAGNWRRFGWLAGVGVVLRPDLVVIIVVVWALHPALRKPRALAALAGAAWRAVLIGAPWYVFSWFHFGSAIPDTLVIKRDQDWGNFFTGLWVRYFDLYPLATSGVLVVGGAGLIALCTLPWIRRGRYQPVVLSVASAGLAGVAYFAAYTQLDVPPYFWYYGIPCAGLTLVAAFAIAASSRKLFRLSLARSLAAAGVAAAALLSPALVGWGQGLANGVPLDEAPIHGNWALTGQYKQIGQDLAKRVPKNAVVRSAGEFGTILYYCDCRLLDRFDNRALIMDALTEARDSSWLGELNYLNLNPDAYRLPVQNFHLDYKNKHTDKPGAWNVWSPTQRAGHYLLRPGPRPDDVEAGLAP